MSELLSNRVLADDQHSAPFNVVLEVGPCPRGGQCLIVEADGHIGRINSADLVRFRSQGQVCPECGPAVSPRSHATAALQEAFTGKESVSAVVKAAAGAQ